MSFILSPTTISSFSPTPSTPSRFPTPTHSPAGHPLSPGVGTVSSSSAGPLPAPTNGLLIPTDRPLDELEGRWLGKLGRLKVDREVVLYGYALYSIRSWYLSRTHFSHTIITQTGKPTEQISAYLVVPHPSLSESDAAYELANAIQILASETQSQPRKTEYGTLLVTTPSAFGQDLSPVVGGDYRIAKPYTLVNTGLRRLGCGGRAFIGLDLPIPALRRKFHELYRIPVPAHAAPLSRTSSPTAASPPKPSSSPLSLNTDLQSPSQSHDAIIFDPFTHLVIELVKLIQSALALWGLYGTGRQDMEIDGLFCDETKAGIFQWRRVMGMEHEESLKLEKETSGGCIDPKTLASLLSSITSVHYELDALGVEKLPKDPFTSIRRFLNTWAGHQMSVGKAPQSCQFLGVSSIRLLNQHYLAERTRHPTDALKVHKLFSGVAHATSNLHANLKGGATEDTPIRKREHHLRFRGEEDGNPHDLVDDGDDSDSGVVMIIPEGEIGSVAPPDVITTDLEAYIKGILKSREKEWDTMGARRVAVLWNGTIAELAEERPRRKGRMSSVSSVAGSYKGPNRNVLKKRTTSRDFGGTNFNGSLREDDEGENLKGAIKGMSGRAGQAIKGGFGLVNRRTPAYETSDSETGGPGPSSLKSVLTRNRKGAVPTVIEPDLEEIDEQLDRDLSASPSPSTDFRPLDRSFGAASTRPSFLTAGSNHAIYSRATSKRPSIVTQMSGNESDLWSGSGISLKGRSPTEERSDLDLSTSLSPTAHLQYTHPLTPLNQMSNRGHARVTSAPSTGTALFPNGNAIADGNGRPGISHSSSDRALAWRNRGRATTMLRTSSDGADVVIEETGMEWEVTNPHGTGKREGAAEAKEVLLLSRRHSLDHLDVYRDMRRITPEHLQIDVEMCAVVLELKEREKQLAQKVRDIKLLEETVFQGASQLVTAIHTRRHDIDVLSSQASQLKTQIEQLEHMEEDETSPTPKDRFHYYLSEETHRPELLEDLGTLREMWLEIRRKNELRRIQVEERAESKTWVGGWFGGLLRGLW